MTLLDPTITNVNDLGSNFYLTDAHVGKSRRDEASITKLKELNGYVTVSIHDKTLEKSIEDFKNFEVVVVTEILPISLINKINAVTRANSKGFIYAAALGISAFAFLDYGEKFKINDLDGEQIKTYLCKNITNENAGIVLIDDSIGTGKFGLVDGDYVTFKEVIGMTEVNDGKPHKVKYISPIAFSIEDTTNYSPYVSSGIIEQVKLPQFQSYKSFAESLWSPYNGKVNEPVDFAKFGRNEFLHACIITLLNCFEEHKFIPGLNCIKNLPEFLDEVKITIKKAKEEKLEWAENSEEFNEFVATNLFLWAKAQIAPVTAFLGGIVAQEIVKFTGKYSPLNQWLWIEFGETVKELPEVNRTLTNSRYDDEIAIFGRETFEKLSNLNLFMIGAGALGCEFLKNFALMGISTGKGLSRIVDNDNIEISNLNRQFLFRLDDVKDSKSKVACKVIQSMNPDINTIDYQSLVAPVNAHVFNSEFWSSQDIVINAVDNINARKYIDSQCTWYNKPLIDSGTLGTKAHVQVIFPHVTSCYNDMNDPVEDGVPMCTIHNFPAMIEHCIEWGRDKFFTLFTEIFTDTKKYLENPEGFLKELRSRGNISLQISALKPILNVLELLTESSYQKCLEFATKKQTEFFDHNIQDILSNFPENYENKDGSMFWSGSKRCPHPIPYSTENDLAHQFVCCTGNLFAQALGIPIERDFEAVKMLTAGIIIPSFSPSGKKVKVNDADPDEDFQIGDAEEKTYASLVSAISQFKGIDANKVTPHDFEKDDDANFHIDFIHVASNLRANNYKINECDRNKTKMIAGKIIPAIASTTASITGLVCLQIYTILHSKNIELMRDANINLALDLIILGEPDKSKKQVDKAYDQIMLGPVKAIPAGFTVWDKIVVDGPLTVKEFIDKMKATYGLEVMIITINNITIVQTFMPSAKNAMGKTIEDVYCEKSKTKQCSKTPYLVLDISSEYEGITALSPKVQYNLTK